MSISPLQRYSRCRRHRRRRLVSVVVARSAGRLARTRASYTRLKPSAALPAKCICLGSARARPYKTPHYSRVMPRVCTSMLLSSCFFFLSSLLSPYLATFVLPLKVLRQPLARARALARVVSLSSSSLSFCPRALLRTNARRM